MNGNNLAQYCDEGGNTLLGSDSVFWIDGRWNLRTIGEKASEYRGRYRKNFPHKYEAMTHYVYRGVVRKVW